MSEPNGLIAAFILDGQGGGRPVGWEGVADWSESQGTLWVHLDYTQSDSVTWLERSSGLDESVVSALTAEETRPRSIATPAGLLVVLRGVNFNPGYDLEDMVAIRMFVEPHRIISTRHRRLRAVDAVRESLRTGLGPANSAEFIVDVAEQITVRIGTVLSGLDDRVDALEDEILTGESFELRARIGELRREMVSLRRYLAPQRDAVAHLQHERLAWFSDGVRAQLREIADRTARFVEDLDSARERAAVTQDELNGRINERMSRTMYLLSIITGIFLPLGLLTGLLGINVGGMPGTNSSNAFFVVCGVLVVVAIVQVVVFRRMRWL